MLKSCNLLAYYPNFWGVSKLDLQALLLFFSVLTSFNSVFTKQRDKTQKIILLIVE